MVTYNIQNLIKKTCNTFQLKTFYLSIITTNNQKINAKSNKKQKICIFNL